MFDFLSLLYPWTKVLHIIAVISWMAALLYLPRLLVYHAEHVGQSGDTHELFQMMEYKLCRVIMSPAMHATWVFGLMLVLTPGLVSWDMVWPWVKAGCVVSMTVFHIWLRRRVNDFAEGRNQRSGKYFRFMNEVPTVLMILIVISVVVKF